MEQHRKDRIKWEIRQAVRDVRKNWWIYLLLLASIFLSGGPFLRSFIWA